MDYINSIYAIGLSHKAIAVYIYLEKYCDRKTGTCFRSIKTIARDLNLSYPTVCKAIKELQSNGCIKKENRFRDNGGKSSNLYSLLF